MSEADEVRDVLRRYGEMYRSRDPERLDETMELFVTGDEPEMVGTEAVSRGGPDWAVGAHQVRALTEWDWRFWWEVELDVPEARVSVAGDVAWVTLPGALVQSERAREGTRAFVRDASLGRLRDILADDALTLEERLADVAHVAGARAWELQAPVGARRAITLSAVLVRRGGAWLLHTTHWAVAAE